MELNDEKDREDPEYERSRKEIMKINSKNFHNPMQDSSVQ
jgi:hypothetical protein